MSPKVSKFVFSAVAILFSCAIAYEEVHAEVQEAAKGKAATAPQITMGNGKRNSIQMQGMTRAEGVTQFSESRVNNGVTSRFRGDSVALTFPEVVIEDTGFLVLHPVMDSRPNGDVVSGFAYLQAGRNRDVTIHMNTPADPGRKFMVMLHSDVDKDRVLDFVFVEDGINVEDTAVLEGTTLVGHVFAVPE